MKNILFLLIAFLIFSCEHHSGNSQLKIYLIQGLSGDTLFIIDKKDIACVDWQHQSFKLKEDVSRKIDHLPLLASSKYYFSFTLDSIEYYKAFIFSKYASYSIPKESPFIVFRDKPFYSIFYDNWLVIKYHRKKEDLYYERVFDKKIYDFLSINGLLKGEKWYCLDGKKSSDIQPDEKISDNFKNRFGEEYEYP